MFQFVTPETASHEVVIETPSKRRSKPIPAHSIDQWPLTPPAWSLSMPPRFRLGIPEESYFPPRCRQARRIISARALATGRFGTMTNKASGRSTALLAIALLLGLASASQAGADNVWPSAASPQASTTDTSNAPATQVVAPEQLNDVDRALRPEAQPSQTTATAQTDTQGQSMVPVVASSSGENSGSDTSSLIGKVFIGFGTLLTLGSSAARMLMG
jgi:hypothetical protein